MRRRYPAAGRVAALTAAFAVWGFALSTFAVQRFPRPDFASDYAPPDITVPAPRSARFDTVDTAVLAAALVLASYLALYRRSRSGLLWLTAFSLGYFGFWRRGCICAVGSVQNVALGWADAGYAVPFTVLAFFLLPLVFTLFAGRTFCAAVCPLGAVQELVVWKPQKLPMWLNHVLGTIPWIYLCVAVLFAATGAGFLICRWDPFVGFFRLGASLPMLLFGVFVLAVGLFIGRPYCRFLCPYGALLGVMSRLSRRHVTITPDACIQCRLCENACPYDAIRRPVPSAPAEPVRRGVRRIVILLAALPVAALGAAGAGYVFGQVLSQHHRQVALALEVRTIIEEGASADVSLAAEAFLATGRPVADVFAEARAVQRIFAGGGAVLGAVLAVLTGLKLLGLSVWRSRADYEPDRAECFSCARCFAYCPVEPGKARS